jgi:apolipoprotein N-acyltransferase
VLRSYRALHEQGGQIAALYGFVALATLLEWTGFALSEQGAWTTSANALLTDLPLLQLASLGGLGLIALVMAWVAAMIAALLLAPAPRRLWVHAVAVGATLLIVYGFGALRLDRQVGEERNVRAAAVVTDLGMGTDGLPGEAELRANTELLFARSERAVERGAQLVVWNEAAAFVRPAQEAELVARGKSFARMHGVDLVMAYGVLVSDTPMSFRNEYLWLDPDGQALEQYAKHHPVPGEPSLRGTTPLRANARPWGKSVGAICYDYDFPEMAIEHARLGADLAVVPSSDWRGIDPYHTLMARVRAIEGGFSVLRSVRWASSAGFDAMGRVRGWMPANDPEGVMVVKLPTERVSTLYARVGDAPVVTFSASLLVGTISVALRRRRTS